MPLLGQRFEHVVLSCNTTSDRAIILIRKRIQKGFRCKLLIIIFEFLVINKNRNLFASAYSVLVLSLLLSRVYIMVVLYLGNFHHKIIYFSIIISLQTRLLLNMGYARSAILSNTFKFDIWMSTWVIYTTINWQEIFSALIHMKSILITTYTGYEEVVIGL